MPAGANHSYPPSSRFCQRGRGARVAGHRSGPARRPTGRAEHHKRPGDADEAWTERPVRRNKGAGRPQGNGALPVGQDTARGPSPGSCPASRFRRRRAVAAFTIRDRGAHAPRPGRDIPAGTAGPRGWRPGRGRGSACGIFKAAAMRRVCPDVGPSRLSGDPGMPVPRGLVTGLAAAPSSMRCDTLGPLMPIFAMEIVPT